MRLANEIRSMKGRLEYLEKEIQKVPPDVVALGNVCPVANCKGTLVILNFATHHPADVRYRETANAEYQCSCGHEITVKRM